MNFSVWTLKPCKNFKDVNWIYQLFGVQYKMNLKVNHAYMKQNTIC